MDWTELFVSIGQGLVPIVGLLVLGIIGALVNVAVAHIKAWSGVQISKTQQDMAEALAYNAVAFVEEQARKALKAADPTPDSDTKMEMAVKYVFAQAEAQGLPRMARDRIVELIEAQLGYARPYDERVAPRDKLETTVNDGPAVKP